MDAIYRPPKERAPYRLLIASTDERLAQAQVRFPLEREQVTSNRALLDYPTLAAMNFVLYDQELERGDSRGVRVLRRKQPDLPIVRFTRQEAPRVLEYTGEVSIAEPQHNHFWLEMRYDGMAIPRYSTILQTKKTMV